MDPKKQVAITGLAIIAALLLAGCSLLSVTIGNSIRNSKSAPDANSASITRKRAKLTRAMEADFGALGAGTDFVRQAIATDDRCYKGENDWKVQSGFAHRCTIRITHFYGMNGDFPAKMIGLENLLSANGWTLPRASITELLTGYYDKFCGSRRMAVFGRGAITPSCSLAELSKPHERYTKRNLELFISFAEKEAKDLSRMDDVQSINWSTPVLTYDKKEFQNVRVLFQEMTQSYQYVLAVSIQATYFEN